MCACTMLFSELSRYPVQYLSSFSWLEDCVPHIPQKGISIRLCSRAGFFYAFPGDWSRTFATVMFVVLRTEEQSWMFFLNKAVFLKFSDDGCLIASQNFCGAPGRGVLAHHIGQEFFFALFHGFFKCGKVCFFWRALLLRNVGWKKLRSNDGIWAENNGMFYGIFQFAHVSRP